jgi:DNA repair exonuclease SbcCD ATPase subunit
MPTRAGVLFSILFLGTVKLCAQATEAKVDFQKKQLSAAVIVVSCNETVAEEGLKEFMAKKGSKPSGYKGMTVFRSIALDSASTEPNDLYFKFDKKSKDLTAITMVPTKKGEDFLTQAGADQAKIDQSKTFLNQLGPFIESHNINVQVSEQQKVLNKANKKLAGLIDDSTDLAKKIRSLQSDINQNKNDFDKQQKVLDGISTADFDAHQKAQKKLNSLADDRGSLEKKLRKAQSDLDENKIQQNTQRQIIQKEQDALGAIKSKQK